MKQEAGCFIIHAPVKIKLFCRSLLFLFGTFLHEFSHFAAALVFGKPEKFSLMPKIEGDTFIFGEVRAKVRYKALSVFIASAPLIWWAVLVLLLKDALSDFCSPDMNLSSIEIFRKKMHSFSSRDVFSLWFASQLLWAGLLSLQDIKTCFRGIISPSGVTFISLMILLHQFFR